MEHKVLKSSTPISDKVISIIAVSSTIAFKAISLFCYVAGYTFAFCCKLVSAAIMFPIYIFRFLCGGIVLFIGLMVFLFIGKLMLFFLF